MVPHLACFVQGRDPEREDVSGAITGYTSSTRYSVRFCRACTHCACTLTFTLCAFLLILARCAHHAHTMRKRCA